VSTATRRKTMQQKKLFSVFEPHNTFHLNSHAEIRKPEEEKDNADSTKQKQVLKKTLIIGAYVSKQSYDQLLLSTAEVNIHNEYGMSTISRVLLDSASQYNFITESMAQI